MINFKSFKSIPVMAAAVAMLAIAPIPSGGLFGEATAVAQNKEKKKVATRKVPALSLKVHKQISKAQEAMELADLTTAKEILTNVLGSKRINDYERSVIWQVTAQIAFEENDTPATIVAYEKILTFSESIPVAQELQTIYSLAQLYYSIENYPKALTYLNIWEPRSAEFVGVSQLNFIGTVHYVLGDFPKSINYIDRLIAKAQADDTVEIKESWYGLKLSSHWELSQYGKVRDVLEILLVGWPKPVYWSQLAGVYQELGEDEISYSLMEASYKQGFLDDKPAQLINVAQIQLARDAPIKCAWILKKALNEDRVEANAKNLKTFGQCYLAAAEYTKAIDPLSRSATQEDDADLWFQIGQLENGREQPKAAIKAFDKAIVGYKAQKTSKSVTKRFLTMMARARVLIEEKRFKEASKAFDEAAKVGKKKGQRRSIKQLRAYLKSERVREETLKG